MNFYSILQVCIWPNNVKSSKLSTFCQLSLHLHIIPQQKQQELSSVERIIWRCFTRTNPSASFGPYSGLKESLETSKNLQTCKIQTSLILSVEVQRSGAYGEKIHCCVQTISLKINKKIWANTKINHTVTTLISLWIMLLPSFSTVSSLNKKK